MERSLDRLMSKMCIRDRDIHDNRTIIDTLNIGWELLGLLPREELDRIDTKILDKYYKPADAASDAS